MERTTEKLIEESYNLITNNIKKASDDVHSLLGKYKNNNVGTICLLTIMKLTANTNLKHLKKQLSNSTHQKVISFIEDYIKKGSEFVEEKNNY